MDEPNYRKIQVWQKAHANALSIISLLEKCSSKYSRIFDSGHVCSDKKIVLTIEKENIEVIKILSTILSNLQS